ncbi:hypothetical protein [Aridibaculum aurantiacum]|uniref:hypothetical protein n=1 Tax=Aridibaculum aurantiacum TaxID=2810307 RepID=UPI001A95E5BC|nr:hypothetical protein [Aridibaculum aurantiacum]
MKEAEYFQQQGYHVHLVFTQYLEYLQKEDEKIIKANRFSYSVLDWTGKTKTSGIRRLASGLLQKIAFKAVVVKRGTVGSAHFVSLNRNYHWQKQQASKVKADLYIAHNLGALPVAVAAAKVNRAKCGFDAEDLHTHEVSNDSTHPDVVLKKSVEEALLPELTYMIAASPLIADNYQQYRKNKIDTVLNVFPRLEFTPAEISPEEPLKLFWFSQTIGPGRGLEEVIGALNELHDKNIEMHLLGALSSEDETYFNRLAVEKVRERIHYYPPISPDEVLPFSTNFHVGLAAETGFPLNRDLCLTNKIFTYIQGGLAILASDTKAQQLFLHQHPNLGFIYKRGDKAGIIDALATYCHDKSILSTHRKNAYSLGQNELNWELETTIYETQILPSVLGA